MFKGRFQAFVKFLSRCVVFLVGLGEGWESFKTSVLPLQISHFCHAFSLPLTRVRRACGAGCRLVLCLLRQYLSKSLPSDGAWN